jgi:hypothetical protein
MLLSMDISEKRMMADDGHSSMTVFLLSRMKMSNTADMITNTPIIIAGSRMLL